MAPLTSRAVKSVPAPGGYGTIIRIGRVGYAVCAETSALAAIAASTTNLVRRARSVTLDLLHISVACGCFRLIAAPASQRRLQFARERESCQSRWDDPHAVQPGHRTEKQQCHLSVVNSPAGSSDFPMTIFPLTSWTAQRA